MSTTLSTGLIVSRTYLAYSFIKSLPSPLPWYSVRTATECTPMKRPAGSWPMMPPFESRATSPLSCHFSGILIELSVIRFADTLFPITCAMSWGGSVSGFPGFSMNNPRQGSGHAVRRYISYRSMLIENFQAPSWHCKLFCWVEVGRMEHTFSLEHCSCSGKALSTSTQLGTSDTDNGRTKAVMFWLESPAKFTVFDIVLDGEIVEIVL